MKRAALYTVLLLRAAEAATIQGTVVEHVSGRPLARAQVQLTTVGPQGAGGGIETHASSTGQFRFSNLSAGVYLVSAVRVGFATAQYGQKDWKGTGLPIVLAERESSVVLELRLRRLGAITGMVWDENQVGLPEQDVVLYEGVHPLRMLTRVKTDDRGIYRFCQLRPGRYYVRTRGKMLDETGGPLPTFFRDSVPLENATLVAAELDEQSVDVNIQPPFGKLYTVTGTVLRPPRSQLTVELMSDMGAVGGSVDESGRFTFEQLAPGTYELQGEASDFRGQKFGGYRKIVVDQDIDTTLEMPLQPQLYFDFEDQHGAKIDGRQATVWARRKGLAGEGPRRHVRSLDPLPPGLWEISVTPPADMIVASITALERGDYSSPPAADGWKELFSQGGRVTPVKVVLSTAQASLHGKVIDSGKVAAGAPVFLEPSDLEWGAGLLTMRTA